MTPRPELYAEVAAQLERDEEPMSLEWMQRRAVSLEEMRALSQGIALVLRGYLAMPAAEQMRMVSRGVLAPRSFCQRNQTNSENINEDHS